MPREVSLRLDLKLTIWGECDLEALTVIGGRVPRPALWLVLELHLTIDPREVT